MHWCWKGMLLLVLGVALSLRVTAQPETGIYESPCGPALGPGTLTYDITLVLNGREVRKQVKVEAKKGGDPSKGEIPVFVPPVRMENESRLDYGKRWFDARAEFSQKKAQAIANAINKAFELQGDNKATTGISLQEDVDFPKPPGMADLGKMRRENNEFGAFIVPNVSKQADGQPKLRIIQGRLLGEGRDGGRFLPSPSGGSPGVRIGMGLVDPEDTMLVATGENPLGAPSIVEMGIGEIYVSMLEPDPGMDAISILRWFEADLANHGIPTVFDDQRKMLFLADPLPDGMTFRWGNTDTGQEFLVEFTPVPEPCTLALWLSGFAAPVIASLRRRR